MLAELLLMSHTVGSPAPPSAIEAWLVGRLQAFPGVMGVAATHLETGETIAFNADVRFPTASAIKTAVMVEVFHQEAAGRLRQDQLLTLTDDVKVGGSGVLHGLRGGGQHSVADLLYLMIATSDNTATNMLIGLVGTRAVNERMAAYGLLLTRLYRPTFRGGRADAWPEEEKEFGLGSTTPREMARLMEQIARGRVVSPAKSDQMIALLRKQQVRDLLPRRLPGEEAKVWVAHKTGQDDEKQVDAAGVQGSVRADAGIVSTPRGRYVIAIFARRVRDDRGTADHEALVTGAEVSRMVFDHYMR
jgi:beta-lactamase class A